MKVGYFGPGRAPAPGAPSPFLQAFRQGLSDLGYVEGRDIVIESRWAGGQLERLPEMAAELVRLNVDVIAAVGAVFARAAKNATATIPIVFAMVIDPVAAGLASALHKPGGNATGLTTFDPQQSRRQLELLKAAIPGVARVALLEEHDMLVDLVGASVDHARAIGLQAFPVRVRGPNPDLEGAFETARRERADAVLILERPITVTHQRQIAELALKHRVPTLFEGSYADAGGLISYGASMVEANRRMAAYVDKILKGAKPGDLPVETLKRPELIINLKTAREIGVTIPPEVLKRADQIIQ